MLKKVVYVCRTNEKINNDFYTNFPNKKIQVLSCEPEDQRLLEDVREVQRAQKDLGFNVCVAPFKSSMVQTSESQD